MDRRVVHLMDAGRRGRMALAVARLNAGSPAASTLFIPPKDEPETIMMVSFEGIGEREQEAALAAFPGGKRFVLVN